MSIQYLKKAKKTSSSDETKTKEGNEKGVIFRLIKSLDN